MPSLRQAWALPAALLAIINISATWYHLVSEQVPEPYLDEVFHVPQAQKYCRRDYSWDPKITTPPGLYDDNIDLKYDQRRRAADRCRYLVTKLLEPLLGCDTSSLRALNAGAICIICPLSYGILRLMRARSRVTESLQKSKDLSKSEENAEDEDPTIILDAHSAFNIALFPPLFFFSALFYTDVVSTLVVLLSYSVFLKKRTATGSIIENINAVSVGAMALLFRQTNIFWVAVFPAGLTVVAALSPTGPPHVNSRVGDTSAVLQKSWSEGIIYDCLAQDAELKDYVLFLVSVVLAALRRPLLVSKVVIPYLFLVALFAGFVAWNGSVVLGDKTAHTVTVHLPQMLYLWPYIAFFSAPLIVGPLLGPVVPLLPKRLQTIFINFNISHRRVSPSFLLNAFFVLGSLAAVHFNTIVHPYTLADNRHYVFYVFRILRRQAAIKYLAVPLYYVCAWLVLQALVLSPNSKKDTKRQRGDHPTSHKADRQPCQISFIVIWLAATTLSVVTAPLVEPRYFIVPWIIWRLHMPYFPASFSKDRVTGKVSYDMRLGLETVWLLAINAAISYTFLYKGFAWPSEPGKMQRFIW